jgi:ferredoxin-NADP reductase
MADRMKLRVRRRESVADGVISLELESMAGLPLPPWEPGAHIEIRTISGLLRHYSLCGDPADRHTYRIAILRVADGRGGSLELHETAQPGSALEIGTPKNRFRLEPADEYLFLAGGIGITPMLSMIGQAESSGATWRLVYGGRTRTSMAFLDGLRTRHPDRVAVFADDVEGRPDVAEEVAALRPGGLIYACGPEGLLELVTSVVEVAGRSDGLRFERFTGSAADTSGDPFDVELARSGVTLAVGSGETILKAMRSKGLSSSFSCESGYCGACEATVLDGEPVHLDTYLTDEEKEEGFTMMICVSRCAGDLIVLDL